MNHGSANCNTCRKRWWDLWCRENGSLLLKWKGCWVGVGLQRGNGTTDRWPGLPPSRVGCRWGHHVVPLARKCSRRLFQKSEDRWCDLNHCSEMALPITCVIFDAWRDTKVAVWKIWKERLKNWPLPTWPRWSILRVSWACVWEIYMHWIISLACTRWFILWGKMEKWSWSTTRRTFYPNERARPPSDSTCTMTISVTSSTCPKFNTVNALLVSNAMPCFPKAYRLQRHERNCDENFLFGRLVIRCLGGIIHC